jgi:uncharacterized protein YodC (DUF2158 family)
MSDWTPNPTVADGKAFSKRGGLMADEIKVGDVVVLKSGGPDMTVNSIGKKQYEDYDSAWCSWFDGKKATNNVFPLTSLKKSDS